MDRISIRGARTHNLKNINLDLPRDALIVITGLSGSGKSSLAFDTLYAEGQRRYVESLSAYARQFLALMEKPDVDGIVGLSPAIAIDQKSTSHNPRSTVGTVTEVHDYLRLLFARIGVPHCCGQPIEAQTISQMVDRTLQLPEGTRIMILGPAVQGRKGDHKKLLRTVSAQGFIRAKIDGELYELDEAPPLDGKKKHHIEIVIDRLKTRDDIAARLAESFETALRLGNGQALVEDLDNAQIFRFSELHSCPKCGHSFPPLEPRLFSFNNPAGACTRCDGLGEITVFSPERIIPEPELALADGAIRPWDNSERKMALLQEAAERLHIDFQSSWQALPEEIQTFFLHGDDTFEGVIPHLERRKRESHSLHALEEINRYQIKEVCPECHGTRLRADARNVLIEGLGIHEISALSIKKTLAFFQDLELAGQKAVIGARILKEIKERLQFLIDVGLDYLNLGRSATTLSGGEAQRIRLASQIGAGLTGVLYVLDEPSIGLHQRDNARLLQSLVRLKTLGNTVVVVEHDEDAMLLADYLVDMGPGAGPHGGEVIASGAPQDIVTHSASLTGQYLAGTLTIAPPEERKEPNPERQLKLRQATGNNLKGVDVELPLGLFCCITGVSGSGKSTLINDTLVPFLQQALHRSNTQPAPFATVEGWQELDKIVAIDQSPIGRTPRSNPATYTGLFTPIRELFAAVPEARTRGYGVGRFSFNVKGGRCEACQGEGLIRVEMHFLPDVYVPCEVCGGARYNRETLEIHYKGKTIHDVLQMTCSEAREFFDPIPSVARRLQTLIDVGLGYIQIGQSATTLSGGEAQRVKLAKELSRRDTGNTLYVLDEPTTGLHFHDIAQLLQVLIRLRDAGNTIVIIEHNLDVIKTADWIVDLGPEGGEGGGQVLCMGNPETIMAHASSHTGHYLRLHLDREGKRKS